MRTERLPGGGMAHYIGASKDSQCQCGRSRLPGESGCRDCMGHRSLVDYLQRNAMRGDISWNRIVELDHKLIDAGLCVVWQHAPAHVPVTAHNVMEAVQA